MGPGAFSAHLIGYKIICMALPCPRGFAQVPYGVWSGQVHHSGQVASWFVKPARVGSSIGSSRGPGGRAGQLRVVWAYRNVLGAQRVFHGFGRGE